MKIALFILVVTCAAFGADAPLIPLIPPPPGFEWLTPKIMFELLALPGVGPYLTAALQYVGAIAAVFTALTVFVTAVMQTFRVFAWGVGLQPLADWLERAHRAVYPYLAYLSIFNAPPMRKRQPRGTIPY